MVAVERSAMELRVVQTSDLVGVSDYLKQAFQGTEVDYQMKSCLTGEETIVAARDADVLMLVPAYQEPISRKVIAGLPKCRYILALTSGYDDIDVVAATESGILVTNMPDLFYEQVADHAMALLLACARKIVELNQLVKRGEWAANIMDSKIGREIYPKMVRLQGQTLGLIGFGHTARSVATKAKGFGMRLIAFDPYISSGVLEESEVEQVEFDYLLRESDFVLVLPLLSDETRGMLGWEEFNKLKPTAYVINTARGPIINRDALYTALTEGLIAGAGLDVTEPEPSTLENNPLVGLDNVIMTPHSAGQDVVAFRNLAQLAAEQVLRFARGERPQNLINPEVKEKHIQK